MPMVHVKPNIETYHQDKFRRANDFWQRPCNSLRLFPLRAGPIGDRHQRHAQLSRNETDTLKEQVRVCLQVNRYPK